MRKWEKEEKDLSRGGIRRRDHEGGNGESGSDFN